MQYTGYSTIGRKKKNKRVWQDRFLFILSVTQKRKHNKAQSNIYKCVCVPLCGRSGEEGPVAGEGGEGAASAGEPAGGPQEEAGGAEAEGREASSPPGGEAASEAREEQGW